MIEGDEWIRFDHPEELFSLSYPPTWSQIRPISESAAFACRASDGSALIEVVCLGPWGQAGGPRKLVDVIVEGVVKYAADEPGTTRRRVIAQNAFPFGGAERCVDVLIAYRNEAESNVEMSADYFVVGSSAHALQIALKTTTGLFPSRITTFERVLGTLRTPWMKATAPPNLSRGATAHRD